jgi:hypothetical protein
MGISDNIRSAVGNAVIWALTGMENDTYEREYSARVGLMATLGAYYKGNQPRPLKPSKDGKDFNVLVNLSGLIINRSVSMLMGAGVTFEHADEAAKEYINKVWSKNRKDNFLHDLAQFGGTYGTEYIKIIPGGLPDGTDRLVALNPLQLVIGCNPHDIERVEYYVVRYNGYQDGQETAYREVTKRDESGNGWVILNQHYNRKTGSRWVTDSELAWGYPFAPIAHAKNLPNAGEVYGQADLMGVLDLQNDYNQAQSNINKVLWYHGHPRLYIKGGRMDALVDWGPDKIAQLIGDNAELKALEMAGDLEASRRFASDIRRDMMDVSATTDIETIKDKIGQLTNFGVRLLFKDELAKRATKQMLYGELLTEVNRRILYLAGQTEADGGWVVWGEPLPENATEETNALKTDIELGLLSKETAAGERGYDWKKEQERMQAEETASGNVGGVILNSFLRGNRTGGGA